MLLDASGKRIVSRRVKEAYSPQNIDQALDHVVEECGEVIAAYGKMRRFGPQSVNVELPVEQQETNGDALLRELGDLLGAMIRLRDFMEDE